MYVCEEHGFVHQCGTKCKDAIPCEGQFVCSVTGRVLTNVHVGAKRGATDVRNDNDRRGAKRQKVLDSDWVAKMRSKPTVVLTDIMMLPVAQTKVKTSKSRNRRPARTNVSLSKIVGLIHQLLSGPKRKTLEQKNYNKRKKMMKEVGAKALSAAQKAGRPLSVVKTMALMEASLDLDTYRFIVSDGPLSDEMTKVLAVYIQGAYRVVATIREQLKQYFLLPDEQRTHGVTRGQMSKCSAKMDVKTFVAQMVGIMGSGGLQSNLGERRELIPASPLCQVAMPVFGQLSEVLGKLSRFNLSAILKQADQIPNELVGDPALTIERCVPAYENLMVCSEAPRPILSVSLLRNPCDVGPFYVCQPDESVGEAVVLSLDQAGKLGLRSTEGPFQTWEEADSKCRAITTNIRSDKKLGVARLWG
jgi:hypothetical protein